MENMEAQITVKNLVSVTYQANAHVTPYHFIGNTEAEARQKLADWLAKKPIKIDTGPDGDTIEVHGDGRGQANNGKVWMIHHSKQLRERVLPADVDAYLAQGFEKGGPRTSFRS